MSQVSADRLFARWFWVVYLPLGLLGALVVVVVSGVVRRPPLLLTLVAAAYGAIAIRLLYERRRRRLVVRAPSALVGGLAWISGVGLTGAVLLWTGLERLHATAGAVLSLSGGFLILVAVLAPLLRGIDVAVRKLGGLIARAVAPRSARPRSERRGPYVDEEEDMPTSQVLPRSDESLPYAAGSSQGAGRS